MHALPDVLECLRERCAERLRQEDCDDSADQTRESHDEERDGHGLDADNEGRKYSTNPGGIFDWVNILFFHLSNPTWRRWSRRRRPYRVWRGGRALPCRGRPWRTRRRSRTYLSRQLLGGFDIKISKLLPVPARVRVVVSHDTLVKPAAMHVTPAKTLRDLHHLILRAPRLIS